MNFVFSIFIVSAALAAVWSAPADKANGGKKKSLAIDSVVGEVSSPIDTDTSGDSRSDPGGDNILVKRSPLDQADQQHNVRAGGKQQRSFFDSIFAPFNWFKDFFFGDFFSKPGGEVNVPMRRSMGTGKGSV